MKELGIEDTYILTCDLIEWRLNRLANEVTAYVGVGRYQNRWVIVGLGLERSEVKQLINRYQQGDPFILYPNKEF